MKNIDKALKILVCIAIGIWISKQIGLTDLVSDTWDDVTGYFHTPTEAEKVRYYKQNRKLKPSIQRSIDNAERAAERALNSIYQ